LLLIRRNAQYYTTWQPSQNICIRYWGKNPTRDGGNA